MVLIKEIELALKPENNEVRAQEDEILADSVLELADTDFTKTDNFEDLAPGSIRKHVEADMRVAYPGKPTSRKRIFKDKLKGDEAVKKGSQWKTDTSSGSDIEESSGDEDDAEEEGGEDDSEADGSEADDSEEDSLADESEEGSEEGDGEGEGEVDSEEDMDGEFDGSILGDEKTDGSGSEVEEEDDENDKEDLDDTKGIDYFSSRARDIEADVAKGRSIKNQLTIWETLIECRIKLQPCLLNINKLYQKESFQDFRSSLNEEEEQTVLETYSALSNLMKGLLDLQENLLNAVPSYVETKSQKRKAPGNQDNKNEPEKKKKKTGTDLLKEIDEDFKPFRNATIQKWNEKTRVSSGKINKNDFSAFDLPTLKQIEEILLDRERLLKRTHIKRSDYVVLGKHDKPKDDEIEEDNVNENHRKKNQGEYDPEIFDDDDFYHKLLRDFIEKKTSDVSDVSKRGKQWLELQKLRSRMKAKVDTRASKGRKLRFTVHNKMVNFMAPVPNYNWTEEAKNELFKSLFC